MEDQGRSERKSTIAKSDRLRELELQRQAAKFKQKKAEIQQIEVETSLTKKRVDPVENAINTDQLGASGGEIVGYNSSVVRSVIDDDCPRQVTVYTNLQPDRKF